MPVTQGNFLFDIGALVAPSLPGELIAEPVIPEFHHEVNPHRLVSIIVIVTLPDGPEGIDAQFPVIPEIPSQSFHVGSIEVAAEGHALLVGLTTGFDFIASLVGNDLPLGICQLTRSVSKIEIEFPVGTKGECVNSVIVLRSTNLGKERFLLVGLQVSILVRHEPDVISGGDNDLVT